MATYCIICGKKKTGIPIKNDFVLDGLRWIKKNITKNEQGNSLVVCKEDYAKYKKNRDGYNTRRIIYVGTGVLFTIIGIVISPSPQALLVGIALIALLFCLSLLSYIPGLQVEGGIQTEGDKPKNTKHNQ